jgi:hypothetical protein
MLSVEDCIKIAEGEVIAKITKIMDTFSMVLGLLTFLHQLCFGILCQEDCLLHL